MTLKLSDFDYRLPENLIAKHPKKPRDHSRLFVIEKNGKNCEFKHKHFFDLPDYLKAGDVLVLNDTKVFPARLLGKKKDTGGQVEVLLHKQMGDNWECLLKGRNIQAGLEIQLPGKLTGKVLHNNQDGTWLLSFNIKGNAFMSLIEKIGKVPLPPYIEKLRSKIGRDEKNKYQTVYADRNKVGSVAAPTAGLHFTPRLLKNIEKMGVELVYVTLHVGMGTFAPVKEDNIKKHNMHSEWVEVSSDAAAKIIKAKNEKRRVIAVGTTSARTLEAWNMKKEFSGWVNIFIYPPYKFKVVDGLVTNFHLPKSTLLMLISALSDHDTIMYAYTEAIRQKYRFYSYGDAMLII